jgi:F-type H+-transporting ATPase subunit b
MATVGETTAEAAGPEAGHAAEAAAPAADAAHGAAEAAHGAADAAHGAGAAAHGGGHEAATGMPQLDFTTWPSQIFWLLVALVALYFILSRVALPRIGGVIEERQDAIEDDLDRAAEFKRRAALAEQAYEAALADAKAKANGIAAEARAAIQKDLDAAIAKADAQIAAKSAESETRIRQIRDNALASVETVAADTAEALVEALAPGAADAGAVRAAVAQRLQA